MTTQYIYLLKEREFIKTNESILKIGMTKQINHERFKQYPKGSILLFQMICSDCNDNEKQIIELFKNKYIHRKDIGNEYFEGDYTQMMDDIYLIVTYNELFNDKNIVQNIINSKYNPTTYLFWTDYLLIIFFIEYCWFLFR